MWLTRRSALLGLTAGAAIAVAGCSADDDRAPTGDTTDPDTEQTAGDETEENGDAHEIVARSDIATATLDPKDSVAISRAVLEKATAVIVAAQSPPRVPAPGGSASPSPDASPAPDEASGEPADSSTTAPVEGSAATLAGEKALAWKLPMFMAEHEGLLEELDRLQTRTIITFGDVPDLGDREIIEGGHTTVFQPLTPPADTDVAALQLVTEKLLTFARATLKASGIEIVDVAYDDPRATGESVQVAKDHATLLGPGTFGERFTERVDAARTLPELPGGGVAPFPGRMMVALYGHPSGPTLGSLGEQGPDAAAERVKKLAAEYQLFSEKPVIGCFEIITTVASASAGPDGDYSYETPAEEILPLIEAAEKNDIYCVLDLQPGRTDFLTQAKRYEDLLKRPNVGLALDPEWRLKPGQRHMTIIGQVEIDEVNATGAWLADLVRDNKLPPKVLVLHQFQTRMIVGRERLDTSRDEIQYLMHADGHGNHGQKLSTWRALLADLPDGVRLGWKNFIDEDTPMMSVEQTMKMVSPTPDFVSYQ